MLLNLSVLGASVLVQIATAILALRLMKITRCNVAWVLISLAVLGMALRRGINLYHLVAGDYTQPPDLSFELIGLITSILMLSGVALIAPIFSAINHAREEREGLIAELKTALANVRTLSGLLPICASCKKIRDDKGYWNHVESYISKHSGAEFSHSICPDCAKKLYPEFADKKL